ncbi:MAG: hypothetical protein PVJ67_02740 [Candidatus Pacearchaeota archaeon]|jgi:hypothetical protein
MRENRIIALVDMDGVLCDYANQIKKDYDEIKSPNEPELKSAHDNAPSYIKKRVSLIRNQQGWWKKLKPLKPGFEILKILKELNFEIHILTKGPATALNANTEKAEWIENHVGKIGKDVVMHISGDKSIAYGKVLVDDYPPYLKPWLENRPRGIGIMPAQEWNKDFKHERVIRHNGSNIEEVKKALFWAKNRNGPMPKFK